MGSLQAAGLFLVNTLFDLYLFVLMLRVMLSAVGAHYFNPISQFVIKLTDPIVAPLRRVIRNFKKIETATLLIILLLQLLKYFLIGWMTIGFSMNVLGLGILAIVDSLKLVLDIFFYAILLQAILSWLHTAYTPLSVVLTQLTTPILRPFQRVVPLVSGIDLSPLVALIVLQLITIIVVKPLIILGTTIAFL